MTHLRYVSLVAAAGSVITAMIAGGDHRPAPVPAAARPAAFAPPAAAPDMRATRRCDDCGVIESMQRGADCTGQPASYAFTVRMRDGSLRGGQDGPAGSWQVGDRIQLMGGSPALPASAPPAAATACAPPAPAR
jgi:hypothetical protein